MLDIRCLCSPDSWKLLAHILRSPDYVRHSWVGFDDMVAGPPCAILVAGGSQTSHHILQNRGVDCSPKVHHTNFHRRIADSQVHRTTADYHAAHTPIEHPHVAN
jgi:hypothetical protein